MRGNTFEPHAIWTINEASAHQCFWFLLQMTDSTVMHWKLESIYLLLINVCMYMYLQTDRQKYNKQKTHYNCVGSSNKFDLFHVNNSFYPAHIYTKGYLCVHCLCIDWRPTTYPGCYETLRVCTTSPINIARWQRLARLFSAFALTSWNYQICCIVDLELIRLVCYCVSVKQRAACY